MEKSKVNFDHSLCQSCLAMPHCSAGRLVIKFMRDAELEIDQSLHRVVGLINRNKEAIVDNQVDDFQVNTHEAIEIMEDAFERYQSYDQSIDELIIGGIVALRTALTRDYIDECRNRINMARDMFIEKMPISPIVIPSDDAIRAAAIDVLEFQITNDCCQDY